MAKRQNVKRVDSEQVQGAGSYVMVERMTVKKGKELQALRREMDKQERIEKAMQEQDPEWEPEEGTGSEALSLKIASAIMVDHIKGWDWVDNEGNPLPLPSADIDVIDLLTDEEMQFLSQAIMGNEDDRKKK